MMAILLIVIGMATGSFLGALTFRLPRGQTIVKGRSLCDHCKRKIAWHDNIPLFSYFFLGGRCRHCNRQISKRYPFIELSTGLLFLGTYFLLNNCSGALAQTLCSWKDSLKLLTLPYLLFVASVMIAIFVIDLEQKLIPDELSLFGFIVVLVASIFLASFFANVLSGLLVSAILLLIHLATNGRGMGLGDVKLALFAGTFLGWPYALIWLFIAFLTGAQVGIILILLGKASFGKQIPFGPFLVISFFITVVLGQNFLSLILK